MMNRLLTEKWLLDVGFEKKESIILPSYHINISWNNLTYKVISVNIEPGNQYVYIREGESINDRRHDDVVCIFNGDIHGKLYVEYIQKLYQILSGKEL